MIKKNYLIIMKKNNILMFILFTIFTISISKIYVNANELTLLGKVIYLDPGHGGIDSGAVYKKIYEKDLNLEISKKLSENLKKLGATVYLTRETDKDLSTSKNNRKRSDLANRAYLINKTNPDMYISIHLNYINNSKWKGLQIFYNNKNKENKEIAESLTNYLKEKTSNIKDIKYNDTYYMYKRITPPGVLIELGFLSNPNDRYRLTTNKYQEELIDNITKSIENYFKEK